MNAEYDRPHIHRDQQIAIDFNMMQLNCRISKTRRSIFKWHILVETIGSKFYT